MGHVNKYESFSKADELAREYHKRKSCGNKRRHETKLEAIGDSKTCDAYLCKFCGKWHRSGLAFRIANGIKKQVKKNKGWHRRPQREAD